MSFKHGSSVFRLLPFALAALPAASAERHNLILLVPAVLPAAAVDHETAPALARLRAEGVYFINSHSGFPRLTVTGPEAASPHRDVVPLLAAARESYSTALVDDTHVSAIPSLVATSLMGQSTSLNDIVNMRLPRFKAANRPFVLVYRFGTAASNPDDAAKEITLHTGGENEPALREAVRTADEALTAIEGALRQLGLYDTTNIMVAAERGTSFVWKTSATSSVKQVGPHSTRLGTLPTGFLAMDLAAALATQDRGLSLFDPDNGNERVQGALGEHPVLGNGVIAVVPSEPKVFVEARGDHGLIYLSERLSKKGAKRLGQSIVGALFQQDYTAGVFVDESRVGQPRGTLPVNHLGWGGSAAERVPDIVVTFVSTAMKCSSPTLCTVMIADTPLAEGQQLPGSFSRADTWNFMAARGPDFQSRLESQAPASNADVVRTVGELLRLSHELAGDSRARVLTESLRGNEGSEPRVGEHVIASKRTREGSMTQVHLQSVGPTMYFHAAGCPGWTVGIAAVPAPVEWRPWRWDWPRLKRMTISISPEDVEIEPFPRDGSAP